MALNFSKASTHFVRNLVELGVCENTDCLNAYHPPASVSGRSFGSHQRPSSLLAAATTPSTRPMIAVDVPRWIHALDSDDFPLTEVCHQLSSSELQMSQPLEKFIDDLFSTVSRRYGVQLETLVRALRLLERVQMANIRAHHQLLLSQPSLRSGRNSNANSCGSAGTSSHTVAGCDSCAATLEPGSASLLHRTGLLRAAAVPAPPQLGQPFSTSPQQVGRSAPIVCTPACNLGGAHPALLAHGSGWDGSSLSSGTVGPLTDTERLSGCKGTGAPAVSSLTSWCLPTTSPYEVDLAAGAAAAANAVDLPSLLGRLQPCAACAGSRVFTLQYYNVHLLLAACLALSISINELTVMAAVTEDALMHQIAAMSHCTDLSLQVAARVVCETLNGELCVFDGDVDVLVHRLNIVETCVFATDGL